VTSSYNIARLARTVEVTFDQNSNSPLEILKEQTGEFRFWSEYTYAFFFFSVVKQGSTVLCAFWCDYKRWKQGSSHSPLPQGCHTVPWEVKAMYYLQNQWPFFISNIILILKFCGRDTDTCSIIQYWGIKVHHTYDRLDSPDWPWIIKELKVAHTNHKQFELYKL